MPGLGTNSAWLNPLAYQSRASTPRRPALINIGNQAPLWEPTQHLFSTDMGNVSWNVPSQIFDVATFPYRAPVHSWQVTACSGMSIGQKGMLVAAKTLAATAIDLFKNPPLVKAAKKDLDERKKDNQLQPVVAAQPQGSRLSRIAIAVFRSLSRSDDGCLLKYPPPSSPGLRRYFCPQKFWTYRQNSAAISARKGPIFSTNQFSVRRQHQLARARFRYCCSSCDQSLKAGVPLDFKRRSPAKKEHRSHRRCDGDCQRRNRAE